MRARPPFPGRPSSSQDPLPLPGPSPPPRTPSQAPLRNLPPQACRVNPLGRTPLGGRVQPASCDQMLWSPRRGQVAGGGLGFGGDGGMPG